MPSYNIHVSARFTKIRPEVEKIIRRGVPDDAEVVYKSRNVVYRYTINGTPLIIKAFRAPSFINSLVYTHLRKSKALRSYQNGKRLQELGIPTPTPIAYGEVRVDGRLRRSYYISENIEGAEVRCWEKKPDCDALLEAFAADIVRLHRAGILHKDFSPGNVLYKVGPDGSYKFYYIDLNRMVFGVKSRKRLMTMFRCIHHEPEPLRRLAALYAKAAGEDPERVCAEAVALQDKFFAGLERKRRWKKLFSGK